MQRQAWVMAGVAVLAVAGAAYWVMGRTAKQVDAAQSDDSGWGILHPVLGGPSSPQDPLALTPETIRARLFEQGAMSGTEPSGSWCVSEGALQPCADLRRRFDYYGVALGDVAAADLRRFIAEEARKDNGEQVASGIMSLWDNYQRLRAHAWRHPFVQSDPATWAPALEEQQDVRRRILGEDWARAFFETEERHLQAAIGRGATATGDTPSSAPSAPRVPTMKP